MQTQMRRTRIVQLIEFMMDAPLDDFHERLGEEFGDVTRDEYFVASDVAGLLGPKGIPPAQRRRVIDFAVDRRLSAIH